MLKILNEFERYSVKCLILTLVYSSGKIDIK